MKRLIYMARALTFDHWEPRIRDFEIILKWLRHSPFDSYHSHLARIFVSNMDWRVKYNAYLNCMERNYPRDLHVSLCLCIVETFLDSTSPTSPLVRSTSNQLLSEGFRQMSSLASRTIRKTPAQAFSSWAWETISKLHLHALDQEVVL